MFRQSPATEKAVRDTIVACNSLAMAALGRGDATRCRDLLARAFEMASSKKVLTENNDDRRAGREAVGGSSALQVLTLNNTACLHRRYSEYILLRYYLLWIWQHRGRAYSRQEYLTTVLDAMHHKRSRYLLLWVVWVLWVLTSRLAT